MHMLRYAAVTSCLVPLWMTKSLSLKLELGWLSVWLSVGTGDLNSVPHACASALARFDSSPAPLRNIFDRDSNLIHEGLALLT